MTTAFPAAIDTFTNPVSGDYTNSVTVPHDAQHANANDAITAIETAILGIRNDLAASTIVPGATSWSVRNNANSSDNLIITDAGSATLRGTLSLALAASRIVPGATSFAIRNHANTADTLGILDSGQYTYAMTLPAGAPTAYDDLHSITTTFSTLTSPYSPLSNAFRSFAVNIESDTSAQGYPGIMNAFIARVNINSVGATWLKTEGIAGVINFKAGSSGTINGGYAVSGEWLFQAGSTVNVVGTIRGTTGNVSLLGASNCQTAYGTENYVLTTLGQTGVYSTLMQGGRNYAEHDNVGTVGAMTGVSGEALTTTTGTVTNVFQGALAWAHNTGDSTFNGNVYGIQALAQITGAAAFGAATTVYGVFADSIYSGTTTGGVSANVAMNAEMQWSSTGAPATAIYAMQARWRVNAAATVANAEGLHILAPNITNAPTIAAGRGIRIANQGAATVTTAEGLRIDAQSGASTNRAIVTAGGSIELTADSRASFITSASQSLTFSTTTSGTLAVTSAGLLTLTGVGASVWTPGDGSTMVFGTTTGTQIGTVGGASGQKIGWWGAAPAVQPLCATGGGKTVDQLITILQTMGLLRQS